VLSLVAGDEFDFGHARRKIPMYLIVLFQVACVPSRKAGKPLVIIPVPPILAARIFPSPGQQEKPISLPT